MTKIILTLILAVVLQGCTGTELLNPSGSIEADYNPTTGVIHYKSNKDVNVELIKSGESVTLKIYTDAASAIAAREGAGKKDAENISKLLNMIRSSP